MSSIIFQTNQPVSHQLTAVDLVGRGVVPAVVAAVADEGGADAAPVGAGELRGGVAGGEGTATLVAVVAAVVGVVAGVGHRHAAPVVAGEVRGGAGVEGCGGGGGERGEREEIRREKVFRSIDISMLKTL